VIAVEEVWNNFLLSPLEFNRYVDEFQSPWVKAYFDIGNIVKNGWPEDWIRTLGKRIHRVHLKDFSKKKFQFVKLTEGDVNWKEVRKAFQEVGFTSYMTAEFNGDDFLEPEELAKRIDKIIAGE
jgi:hexulose-6-phosphate isomerase